MIDTVLLIAADALAVLGLVILSLAVLGIFRMPDVYTEVQATAKGAALGIAALALASMFSGDGAVIARALLIVAFLVVTAPLAAHALVRAAYLSDEPMYGSEEEDAGEGSAPGPGSRSHPLHDEEA